MSLRRALDEQMGRAQPPAPVGRPRPPVQQDHPDGNSIGHGRKLVVRGTRRYLVRADGTEDFVGIRPKGRK